MSAVVNCYDVLQYELTYSYILLGQTSWKDGGHHYLLHTTMCILNDFVGFPASVKMHLLPENEYWQFCVIVSEYSKKLFQQWRTVSSRSGTLRSTVHGYTFATLGLRLYSCSIFLASTEKWRPESSNIRNRSLWCVQNNQRINLTHRKPECAYKIVHTFPYMPHTCIHAPDSKRDAHRFLAPNSKGIVTPQNRHNKGMLRDKHAQSAHRLKTSDSRSPRRSPTPPPSPVDQKNDERALT